MRARQTARGTVAREEMFMMKKLPRTKVARHLEMLVAYQNNPSEEVILSIYFYLLLLYKGVYKFIALVQEPV